MAAKESQFALNIHEQKCVPWTGRWCSVAFWLAYSYSIILTGSPFSPQHSDELKMPLGLRECGGRGEARMCQCWGSWPKRILPVPSSCWAWCHMWQEYRKPGMYSWIKIHTNVTTWQHTIGDRVAGRVFLWKGKIKRSERSLRNLGAAKQKWFCWAPLGSVGDLAVMSPSHSQVIGPFGNLSECCRPLRKEHFRRFAELWHPWT